jgi:hypothetical protein
VIPNSESRRTNACWKGASRETIRYDGVSQSLGKIIRSHRATFANERCGTVHLDHGEPSTGSRNGVAFSCVSLLSNPQCIQFGWRMGALFSFPEVVLDLTDSSHTLRHPLSSPRGREIRVRQDVKS